MRKQIFFTSILLGIILIVIFLSLYHPKSMQTHNKNLTFSPKTEISSWIWQGPGQLSADDGRKIFQQAQQAGFSKVYLRIDDYLDLWDLKNPDKTAIINFQNQLAQLIEIAQENNIAVEALGGNDQWALSANWYLALELENFVQNYNQTHPEAKLVGLQYDIEYYNLPEYKNSADDVRSDYRNLTNQLFANQKNLKLGFTVRYNLIDQDPTVWQTLSSLISTKGNSYLVDLTYRNQASQTIDISQPILKQASALNPPVYVILAQETTKVAPDSITYFSKGKSALIDDVTTISRQFQNDQCFNGVAIHDLQGFLSLPE